jgi:glycosyltransferase involved in cell wall biosynthesis
MHLVIDATEVGRRRGGNESYISGLVEGLSTLDPLPNVSLLTCQWNTPLLLPDTFHQINLGPYRRLLFFLWQQTTALHQLEANWYLKNFFLPPVVPCKGIVVVHDMSFKAHPEYFPPLVAWYMDWLTRWSVRRAKCVVTVSEFSRHELLGFYAVDQSKVIVIPNGISEEFHPVNDDVGQQADKGILANYSISPPYILALGNIHPRKNLARLLDAYLLLQRRSQSTPPMVWVGLERWDSTSLVAKAYDAGVVLTGFVAQRDLPAFYRQAIMLVYPSLYEGFGLPPLEAMACGTPVVTSNTTSLPEVVGDAALTVDPTAVEAIAEAIARILDNVSLRQHLRKAGIERSKSFTWHHTALHLISHLKNS